MKLLVLVVAALFSFVQCDIKTLTPCKGQLDDGRLVDLTSLDNAQNPMVDDSGDYNYKYNPCKPIPCDKGGPVTAAVCQSSKDAIYNYICGTISSAQFSLDDDNNAVISYSANPKKSVLTCICGKTQSFSAEETRENLYEMKLTSPCCCPNKDGCKGGGKPSGLSFGSILVIIFFSLLAAYLIFGVIYMKFIKKAEGKEIIPNYNFWVSVPSDFKTGVTFTVNKVTGKGGQYSSI